MTPEEMAAATGDSAWMLMSAALVLLMTPALALFYGGMSRQKSALNMMMMSFGTLGLIGVIYVLWGWSMSYGTETVGGLFSNPFEFFGLKDSVTDANGNYIAGAEGYANVIDIGFQLTFAVITVAIISGSLANRVKFSTWMVFAGIWATLAYFPMAHMVWGGGLLSDGEDGLAAMMFGTVTEDGENVAAIAPIDFAGGTVVHINAGVAALVLALIIGRSRTFMKEGSRPHNLPLVMLGAALLWFGWFGFNGGSAFGANGEAGLAWLNTTAATCAAMLGWLLVERLRDGHTTSLGAASGVVAGLVSVTPAAGDLTPVTAIILGAIGGALAAVGVGLKFRFKFDDSLDVVGVHLVAGIWGTMGIGLLATDRGLLTGGGADGFKLFIVQIVIALVAVVFCTVVTAVIGLALKYTMGWRISGDDESAGIDTTQHAESAYSYSDEEDFEEVDDFDSAQGDAHRANDLADEAHQKS
ncbi:MAG: ammonium transporter [Corynebacterium sp.]|uniref:ammonium transporter n=1 Tax=unclassified Corynebacterium TaxID=2624378 RepID=UPI0026472727|nr:ammonium transporter [Corynebacterium sp.]MDN5582178.1 ammonium transporter [Corynebacterium sp.]MDN5718722.1 ammonium transporter [Corynebacterium sp.]MDN6259305.1 ammonium transporter [Corynebacterium sp.]MDN6509971.1 ammonium transporter [Corynebacterium sp.]